MDRISALRNVEEALAEFESGETDLESAQRKVLAIIGTYATEFEDGELAAYRASGADRADGLVVVAGSTAQARDRIDELLDGGEVPFDVERVEQSV